jgi:ABC-2 type transport system ATP-binding protein
MPTQHAIACQGLVKRYGDVVAVDGLDLQVEEADAGSVEVLGRTWAEAGNALRTRLGTQLQETKFPEKLTVLETVTLFRSFYPRGIAPERALGIVDLEEKRRTWVKNLSGGQRQRLAIAVALVSEPELLFLDEPTAGLDPQSRHQLWDIIGQLKASGRTVLLTTHYMDEAERLCDRVAVIDHGKVIALGTPRELIASLGAEHVVEFATDGATPDADVLFGLPGVRDVRAEDGTLWLTVAQPHAAVPALLDLLTERGATLTRLAIHHATLEDVFLHLTGRSLRDV